MNTIELLLQTGKLDKVFESLQECVVSRTMRNEVLSLQSEWRENEKSWRLGTITNSDYKTTANRIRVAVVDISSRTNMGAPNNSSDDFSGKITTLQQLKKKVRFGFSQELTSTLSVLLDDFLTYESTKRRDELFDVEAVEIEQLNKRYAIFLEAHNRELSTKHAVKVAALKRQLNELEQNLTVEATQAIIDNLIALDVAYVEWKDAASSLNSSNVENFAYQLAEVIDGL